MSIPKVMEDSVTMALDHLCMNIEARVAKLSNLLGKQLHPIYRVAKDNRLVDLKLQSCK